jgi:hypothetical protein
MKRTHTTPWPFNLKVLYEDNLPNGPYADTGGKTVHGNAQMTVKEVWDTYMKVHNETLKQKSASMSRNNSTYTYSFDRQAIKYKGRELVEPEMNIPLEVLGVLSGDEFNIVATQYVNIEIKSPARPGCQVQ